MNILFFINCMMGDADAAAATADADAAMFGVIISLINHHDIDTLRAEYAKGDERDGGKLNINALHPLMGTPLNYAVRYMYSGVFVDQLLEWGADVNIRPNNEEILPLMGVLYNGNLNLIKQLCEHGADVNIKIDDIPIIFELVLQDRQIALKIFGDFGLNVNVRNENEETPLIYAVKRNLAVMVSILIKLGADISLTDNQGQSAMDIAKIGEFNDIIEMLQHAQGAYIKAAR